MSHKIISETANYVDVRFTAPPGAVAFQELHDEGWMLNCGPFQRADGTYTASFFRRTKQRPNPLAKRPEVLVD